MKCKIHLETKHKVCYTQVTIQFVSGTNEEEEIQDEIDYSF